MAIPTNPKPAIYRNLYENTGPADLSLYIDVIEVGYMYVIQVLTVKEIFVLKSFFLIEETTDIIMRTFVIINCPSLNFRGNTYIQVIQLFFIHLCFIHLLDFKQALPFLLIDQIFHTPKRDPGRI